jgi:hypothetical protein
MRKSRKSLEIRQRPFTVDLAKAQGIAPENYLPSQGREFINAGEVIDQYQDYISENGSQCDEVTAMLVEVILKKHAKKNHRKFYGEFNASLKCFEKSENRFAFYEQNKNRSQSLFILNLGKVPPLQIGIGKGVKLHKSPRCSWLPPIQLMPVSSFTLFRTGIRGVFRAPETEFIRRFYQKQASPEYYYQLVLHFASKLELKHKKPNKTRLISSFQSALKSRKN